MNLLTIQDMHILLTQTLQKHGVFAYRDYESEEFDLQLNQVMHEMIYEMVDGTYSVYDKTRKKLSGINYLGPLYIPNTDLGTITPYDDGEKVGYTATIAPSNYYLPIKLTAKLDYTCFNESTRLTEPKTLLSKCRIYTREDLENIVRNNFTAPDKEELVAVVENTNVTVFTGSKVLITPEYTISKIYLDYVRKPANMLFNKDGSGNYQVSGSQNCELDGSAHYDLVEKTAIRIKKITESDPKFIAMLEKANQEQ